MKVLLMAIGTRGDVQPFVAIGTKLKSEGHAVHLAAGHGFSDMIAAKGLQHHTLPIDFQALIQQPEMKDAMNSFTGKLKAYRWASGIMNDQLSALWNIGLQVEPDIILYHFKGAVAPYLARHLSVPAWPVMLQPGFAATRAYPQFLISSRSLGRFGNLVSHKLINATIRFGTRMMMKRWVKASGIKIGARMDELSGYAPSGIAYRLHAYSKHVTSLADDMPETERQVGYAFSEPEPFEPSEALAAFLDEDTPPIYIGFGSMPGTDHQRINDALMGALEKTGQRAVVATGWGGIGELEENERIHVLDSIPHSWLFPRVAAVVHHGGSGTTHEGLRWGKPSMICPMFADQPFFGQRVYELGAGPAPIPQKKITADRLAASIEITLSDATISSAKSLGKKMVNEDGAAAIAKMIEPLS